MSVKIYSRAIQCRDSPGPTLLNKRKCAPWLENLR